MHGVPELERRQITVDGDSASYLSAGSGPLVLLLHGTYWSRVWKPVMLGLAGAGLNPVAVDLPGLGRSGGQLTLSTATVPALAAWASRFVEALSPDSIAGVAGHDIGGAITQHLAVTGPMEVSRFALVNSVSYDSWPVPGVAKYRDPEVVAATTVADIMDARRLAVTSALSQSASEAVVEEYLEPWRELRVARSWMALAGAADSRFTMDLLDRLRSDAHPKLLVWGAEDTFQPLSFAQRFAQETQLTRLEVIPDAGHIPMETDPVRVARALGDFFGSI